jgi:DNA-binding GntR family transcriptional regulator
LNPVFRSVIEIRRFLTTELGNLSAKNSGLSEQLRAMRAACRRFLDSVQCQTQSAFGDAGEGFSVHAVDIRF